MPTKQEVAEYLAGVHYDVDEDIVQVYRALGAHEAAEDPAVPIKLLEVDEGTPAVGVVPIFFGPSMARGIPYSSVIIRLDPEEFQDLGGGVRLPGGWERLEAISRSAALLLPGP